MAKDESTTTTDVEQCKQSQQIPESVVGHDIEDIYKLIGFGRVQWIILLTGALFLLMVLNETMGMSIITLASQCDFETDSVKKAILGSAPFMGIVVSSYFWGYLSDIVGRRKILIPCTLIANLLSCLSMFLPTFWPFVTFRFLTGIFMAGAATTIYAFLGEFYTAYYRPIVINYASLPVGLSSIYFPAVSWLILSMDWSLQITDDFVFRPWRLILACFFLPGLIASIFLIFLPESPKYYLSVNKEKEAYEAVDWICRHTKGACLADLKIFKIKNERQTSDEKLLMASKGSNLLIRMWKDTLPLFQRPYVLNLVISAIVMLGFFMSSAGMGLWYPTIQNRVGLKENTENFETVCQILENIDSTPKTNVSSTVCDETISKKTLIDTMTIGLTMTIGYCILGFIMNPLGRRNILIGSLVISGVCAIALLWIDEPVGIVVGFVIYIALPALCISILSGAMVDLMPTHLRGKAVCVVLMFGRSGTVIGSNIIGALLEQHCTVTFSFFGGFSLFCAALMLLLPL